MALTNLVVLLITAATVSATTTVTLVPIEEGEPGSATNPLQPSDTLCVYVTSDAGLLGLDVVLCVLSGPGTIIDAINCGNPWPGPCVEPPCDGALSFDPLPPPPATCVEIGVGYFAVPPAGIVGWFLLRCDGDGLVTVELNPGTAFGGSLDENLQVPNIHGTLEIYQGSAPNCWDYTECSCQAYGDVTCDGAINLGDLFAFKDAFGQCAPWTAPYCCADLNHDGCVNLADLYIIRSGWGTHICSDPSTGNQNCP